MPRPRTPDNKPEPSGRRPKASGQGPRPGPAEIEAALEPGSIRPLLQPVFELATGRIVGFEGLARLDQLPWREPADWFSVTGAGAMQLRLELAAVEAHLSRLPEIPEPAYLALNVSPATAISAELAAILGGFAAERFVLEISARAAVDDYDALGAGLADLRGRGVRLAVDDAGTGAASLSQLIHLEPDIIKLDMSLTRGVDASQSQRSVAAALIGFAGPMGIAVIAEGIETAAEFTTLLDLGVGYGQGYFLARPRDVETGALGTAQNLPPLASSELVPAIRVAIVDDHAMVAQAVAALLASNRRLTVVGVALDVAGAIELLDSQPVDVVVCDIQLANESGFTLLKRYSERERPRFVMFTSYDHPVYHRAAFEGGAAAFVLKMAEPEELERAIIAAADGVTTFSPATLRAVRSPEGIPTARELAVLERLADGQSTAEVASDLGIRPRTVESHVRALFDRAGVSSRTDLILHAIRDGWIRPRKTRPSGRQVGEGPAGTWLVDAELIESSRGRTAPGRMQRRGS